MIPFRSSTPLRSMRSPCRVKMFRAFPMMAGRERPVAAQTATGTAQQVPFPFSFLGGGRGPPLWACRVACRAIRRPVPFQGAEVQADAASVPRAYFPLAAGASFGREMRVISSMASSLDGRSVSEPVFTAEQVGVMPGTPCGCTDGNGDGLSIAVPVFFLGGRKRAAALGVPGSRPAAICRPVPFQRAEVQANAAPFHGRIFPWRQGRLSAGKCG